MSVLTASSRYEARNYIFSLQNATVYFVIQLGWVCTRHDRHDRWPVIEEENWEVEGRQHVGSDSERTSSDQPFGGDYGFMIGEDSATDDELMFVENAGTCI